MIRASHQRGDTIIEVLLALAVISVVLGGAFVTVNRTFRNARQAQERGEALKVIESQAERLKVKRNDIPDSQDELFCIDDTSNIAPAFNPPGKTSIPPPGPWNPAVACQTINGGVTYHAYIEQVVPPPASHKFSIHVRWDKYGGGGSGFEEASLTYVLPVGQSFPPPGGTVLGFLSGGDGYSPTYWNNGLGNIYTAFHHYGNLAINCRNKDLTPCPNHTFNDYTTGMHSQLALLETGGQKRLFTSARKNSTSQIGIFCYDIIANDICAAPFGEYAPVDTTDFTGAWLGPEMEAAVDSAVLDPTGSRVYTLGKGAGSNDLFLYCVNTNNGSPCFAKQNTNYTIDLTNLSLISINAQAHGNQLFYSVKTESGPGGFPNGGSWTEHVGCFNMSTNLFCWAPKTLQLAPGIYNQGYALLPDRLCMTHENDISIINCIMYATGQVFTAGPGGYLSNLPWAINNAIGSDDWKRSILTYEAYTDPATNKTYVPFAHSADDITPLTGQYGAGYIYCYDNSAHLSCSGFGTGGWLGLGNIPGSLGNGVPGRINPDGTNGAVDRTPPDGLEVQYVPYGMTLVSGCMYVFGDDGRMTTFLPDTGTTPCPGIGREGALLP